MRKLPMTELKTNCGDWHLGWGFGGNDKIGKLTLDFQSNTFRWRGYSQGRHGAKWNQGAKAEFTLNDGKIKILSQKGSLPVTKELISSAEKLLYMQLNNKAK